MRTIVQPDRFETSILEAETLPRLLALYNKWGTLVRQLSPPSPDSFLVSQYLPKRVSEVSQRCEVVKQVLTSPLYVCSVTVTSSGAFNTAFSVSGRGKSALAQPIL